MTNQPQFPFRELSLEQNSEPWHEWRFEGIGASDAAVIMGVSPFKTLAQLVHEKTTGARVILTGPMLRGLRLEPLARAAYERSMEVQVAPLCVESRAHPWLRASLDGISLDRCKMVEIKCGESSYKFARKGKVPPYYYAQLQHQLAVTGLETMDYWCWVKGRKGVNLTVTRDDPYITTLMEREKEFLDGLKRV